MASTDITDYARPTPAGIEALGSELDMIRRDIEQSRGERDAAYIRRTIALQRMLDLASHVVIFAGRTLASWMLGTSALAVAKSIENMEMGHNVGHGQRDMAGLSSQWRYSPNYRHHVHTNVLGLDDDIGFGVMRVTRDQPWQPGHLLQPLRNLLLAATFECGVAARTRELVYKIARQTGKDHLLLPAPAGRGWRRVLTANATANLLRNPWAYVVTFCGHFPDGAEKFTPAVLEHETKPEWHLRQMLGTANFDAGPVLAFLSGNLCHQIEHHLFPDLPSNLCDKYDLPYTTGPLAWQYLLTLRTIHKLALPDRFLAAAADDAPETASQREFSAQIPPAAVDPDHTVTWRGLRIAVSHHADPVRRPPNRPHTARHAGSS